MKFGIRLPVVGPFASKDSIVHTAKLAEELGFDSIWMQGHLLWTKWRESVAPNVGAVESVEKNENPTSFEYYTLAPFIAAQTSNVKLGFAVYLMPLVHPIITAKLMADLDVISDGRLIFCASAAGSLVRPTFDALGIDFANRREMTDEYIEVLQELWTKDNCTFEGKYVQFKDVSIYPKPVQKPHPPIWIAGGNPKSTARAARYGSGWMLSTIDPRGILSNISDYSESIKRCREQAETMGRRGEDITDYSLEIFASIASTDDEAYKIASKTIDARRNLHAKHFTKLPSTEQVQKINLIGSPGTIVKKAEEFELAGATTLELRFIARSFDEMKGMIESFSKNVMSSF